jgi:hypothetical protein
LITFGSIWRENVTFQLTCIYTMDKKELEKEKEKEKEKDKDEKGEQFELPKAVLNRIVKSAVRIVYLKDLSPESLE